MTAHPGAIFGPSPVADACNRVSALAGVPHRVVDVAASDDPELEKTFGPTLIAIALKHARTEAPARTALTASKTYKRLGYEPISLDDGLKGTAEWMRQLGRFHSVLP